MLIHCLSPPVVFCGPLHHGVQQQNGIPIHPKQVRRKRLKETGPHQRKDVHENYPGVFEKETDVDLMADLLDKERKHVRSWAATKLKSKMLNRAHALNLTIGGVRVNKFADISKAWEEDSGDDNAKIMCEILFGDYEGENVSWSHEWEKQFLSQHRREYSLEEKEEDNKKIGCYRSQITQTKIAQVKNINRNFTWKMQMSMPQEYKGGRNGRRKSGDYYLTNTEMANSA